ncbi:magnesium transporter [Peloplasma aerotolerans]|uniref:Magnesium transporter MgtE n=1 Tax=Peloplasma aerotolerans TaxID=3044389 RepID=A0AAW6U943_9MOLU|nr:magnesium transporter [Mariniplasma sp. M4Ah]MDI6452628.1 magnesium transporter [Mariniplasma sp. M4Ah]
MNKKINFKHNDASLKKSLKSVFAYDLAVLYHNLDKDEKRRLLDLVGLEKLTDIFVELDSENQQDLINILEVPKRKSLLRNLESDDLKEFIEELDKEQQTEMIKLLPAVKAKTISLLLTYDDDYAASIMSTEFITIERHLTIKEATNHVVTTSREQDYIDTIFVVDENKKIVGTISLKSLIMARSGTSLNHVINEDFHFVMENDSIEKAIQTVVDYDENSIPVLNKDDQIIGIVTADDIFDEIIENTEDDYQKMALLQDHDSSFTALRRSKQRLPWLMIAVVLNLVIASFISIFEATIAEVTALVLFQPLILAMAGNIGTQSLAVTILGLHLKEFDEKSIPKKHIAKEVIIGFVNSLLLGIASFAFAFTFLTLLPTQDVQRPVEIGTIVFIAIFSSMFISALMGVFVPLFLNKRGINPSAASGPIMTTINDVVALVIYFGAATIAFL